MKLDPTAVEAAAKAMKDVMGRQLHAKPLHGDKKSGNWYADGGSIDFTELFEIGQVAYFASLEAEGGARRGSAIVWDEGMPTEVWLCDTHPLDKVKPAVPVLIIKLPK